MNSVPTDNPDAARSARELERAAASFRRGVRGADAVRSLPVTLAHIDEAIGELAASMVVLAQAVGEYGSPSAVALEDDALPAEARALRWHLHELASRLRAAQDACPAVRLWADDLLAAQAARS
jgi:hypothetical protein